MPAGQGRLRPFFFGENLGQDQANYNAHQGAASPVKSLPPNPWGLFEMHGNVWEWCRDRYGAYGDSSQTDPQGPGTGGYRVLRGGSWLNANPRNVRSARRGWNAPTERDDDAGFRLAGISPCPLNTVSMPADAINFGLSDETLMRLWEAAARDTNCMISHKTTLLEFVRRLESEALYGK